MYLNKLTGFIVRGFAICLVLAGTTLLLITLCDRPTAQFLQQFRDPAFERTAELVSMVGSPIPYFLLSTAAYFLFLEKGQSREKMKWLVARNRALLVFLGSTVSAFLVDLAKYCIGRPTPDLYLTESLYKLHPFSAPWVYNSFPSEHASVSAAMALIFSLFFPVYRPTFVVLAFLVCACRIYLQAHFISDILVGAFVGVVTVVCLRAMMDWLGMTLQPVNAK